MMAEGRHGSRHSWELAFPHFEWQAEVREHTEVEKPAPSSTHPPYLLILPKQFSKWWPSIQTHGPMWAVLTQTTTQGRSQKKSLLIQLGWLASKLPGIHLSQPSSTEVAGPSSHVQLFMWMLRDLNLGPHAFIANVSPHWVVAPAL